MPSTGCETRAAQIRKARSTVPVPEPRRGVRCERHGPKIRQLSLPNTPSRPFNSRPECKSEHGRRMIAIGLLFARILCDMNPTTHLTLQHNQLMPERGILCLKSAFRPEERGNQAKEEEYQCGIVADVRQFCYQIIRTRFLVRTRPEFTSKRPRFPDLFPSPLGKPNCRAPGLLQRSYCAGSRAKGEQPYGSFWCSGSLSKSGQEPPVRLTSPGELAN